MKTRKNQSPVSDGERTVVKKAPTMWLLIDDMRDLEADVIARTAQAGQELLAQHAWEGLLLDHDLGEETTGYDVLVWALERMRVPTKVHLVTSNPVGRERMRAALEADGYTTLNGYSFLKNSNIRGTP